MPVDMPAKGPNQAGFLVVGESIVDLIANADSDVFVARAGGSPFNVAVGMARLGQPVTFITEYGDDHCGRILANRLCSEHLQVRRKSGTTNIAIAKLDANGQASYDFRLQWGLHADDVQLGEPFVGLHTGSLACLIEPGRQALLTAVSEARRQGLAVSYDPNIRPSLAPSRSAARAIVEQFVAAATIVKVSAEDMEWLYPRQNPLRTLRRWAADGDRLVVLTDGPRGCMGLTVTHEISAPAARVTVVDTIGAGDTFIAALLTRLHLNMEVHMAQSLSEHRLRDALEFASRAAAWTCTRTGAAYPSPADIEC